MIRYALPLVAVTALAAPAAAAEIQIAATGPVVELTVSESVEAEPDIATVGALPKGLPSPTVPWTDAGDVLPLLVAAVGITLVSLTDTIALSTSFNARRGERVKPNSEMIGVGSANVVFLPVANRLKELSEAELHFREMTLEGILAIQAGDNPRVVEEKLMAYVPPKDRAAEPAKQGSAPAQKQAA